MTELRLILTAVCFAASAVFILIAVLGTFRFRFVMNRMHCAAVIDSLGLGFLFLGLMIYTWDAAYIPKLIVLLCFWWVGSPIAAHMAGKIEVETDPEVGEHVKLQEDVKEEDIKEKDVKEEDDAVH